MLRASEGPTRSMPGGSRTYSTRARRSRMGHRRSTRHPSTLPRSMPFPMCERAMRAGVGIRSPRRTIVVAAGYLRLVARDGSVRRLDGDSAELARVVLAFFATPHAEAELIAHIESLAGELGERRGVVLELVSLLGEVG